MSEEDYDTVPIIEGAIAFLQCDYCGAKPREVCSLVLDRRPSGKLPGFAHMARRMKYVELRDIMGEAT